MGADHLGQSIDQVTDNEARSFASPLTQLGLALRDLKRRDWLSRPTADLRLSKFAAGQLPLVSPYRGDSGKPDGCGISPCTGNVIPSGSAHSR